MNPLKFAKMEEGEYKGRLILSLYGPEAKDVYESSLFDRMSPNSRLAVVQAMLSGGVVEEYVGKNASFVDVLVNLVEFAAMRPGATRVARQV